MSIFIVDGMYVEDGREIFDEEEEYEEVCNDGDEKKDSKKRKKKEKVPSHVAASASHDVRDMLMKMPSKKKQVSYANYEFNLIWLSFNSL